MREIEKEKTDRFYFWLLAFVLYLLFLIII